MSLFDLFGKKASVPSSEQNKLDRTAQQELYSNTRVEVADFEGNLLFAARLVNLRGNTAELHQYTKDPIPWEGELLRVRIRGYMNRKKKAFYLEGIIKPKSQDVWQAEKLTPAGTGNDRAFFRLKTDLEACAVTFSGSAGGEKPCRLLNISAGGAMIGSQHRYYKGSDFMLKVKLLEDGPLYSIFCRVLRVIEKGDSEFEYGCRFLEMTEEDEEAIIQNIFELQRKKRGISSSSA